MLRLEAPLMVRFHSSRSLWLDTACPAVFLEKLDDFGLDRRVALEQRAGLFARNFLLGRGLQ